MADVILYGVPIQNRECEIWKQKWGGGGNKYYPVWRANPES
jgi:hypothetical protein